MGQSPLDALADRIARIGRRDAETAVGLVASGSRQNSSELVSMVDQAIAAMDDTMRRNEDRTASALEAVAKWMEQAETARAAPERTRPASDQDARLTRTLGLLASRLEEIDGKIAHPDAAGAPLREAMSRIEGRLDALGKLNTTRAGDGVAKSLKELDHRLEEMSQRMERGTAQHAAGRLEGAADIEAKLGAILEQLAQQSSGRVDAKRDRQSRQPAGLPFPVRRGGTDIRRALQQGDLSGALADINARQKDLEADTTRQRLRALGSKLDNQMGRSSRPVRGLDGDAVDELKQQITSLAERMERQQRPTEDAGLKSLQKELHSISSALQELAPRKQMSSIEQAIAALSEKIADSRETGVNERLLQPLEHQLSDIRTMLESNRDSRNLMEISRDIQAMKRRMDAVSGSSVDGEALRDLQSQTSEIRNYVRQSAAKSTGLETLEQRIAIIADRMERSSAAGADNHLADLTSRIDSLHKAVERAPASSIDLHPLETMVQKLSTRIDKIANARAPTGDLEHAILSLEKRLADTTAGASDPKIESLLRSVSTKLDARASSGQQDISRVIEALESKIETLQSSAPANLEFERLIQSIERKIDAIQLKSPDVGQFDRMVQDLAAQMERAQSPGASDATLDALHAQVSRLAARLEATDGHFASLGAMERTFNDIFSQLDSVRHASMESAEKAAQSAVESAVAELKRPDTRTQNTLEAVHDTLETIVERLGMLERDIASSRTAGATPAAPRFASPVFASHIVASPMPDAVQPEQAALRAEALKPLFADAQPADQPSMFAAPKPQATQGDAIDHVPGSDVFASGSSRDAAATARMDESDTLFRTELSASAQALKSAALEAAIAPSAQVVRASAGDPDLPLEPGAGRPQGAQAGAINDAAEVQAGAIEQDHAGRMLSARSKFIEAARRAAQAAAEQSADALGEIGEADKMRAGGNRSSGQAGGKGAIKGAASFRKPLLLGLAAIVFAAGGLSLYQSRSMFLPASPVGDGKADDAASIKVLPGASVSSVEKPDAIDTSDRSQERQQDRAVTTIPAVSPGIAKTGKVSSALEMPASDPVYVGAIPSRKLPSLAQPMTPPNGTIGVASNTPVQDASIDGLRAEATSGNVRSQYDLGSRYIDGRGVATDLKLAIQWLEKSAANGYAPAQYRLGSLYRDGKGLRNDGKLAHAWFKRAAEQGNIRAMHNLAVVLAEGSSGTPDYAGAAEWFRKGAEYGIKDSQFNVAILYGRGLGIGQDLVQSYKWFAAAADAGDEDAGKKRDEIGAKLGPEKLAEAKAEARAYKAKPADPLVNDLGPPAQKPFTAALPVPSRAATKT